MVQGAAGSPAVLSEQESSEALHQLILPVAVRGAAQQQRPVVVVVAGQPGAGKTHIADLVQAALNRRGGAVRIGRDLYKPAHRHYPRLLAADVRTAGALVRPDTVRWQTTVEAHVRDRGLDAVVESALADPDDFRASSRAYRAAGHRVEVVALATAEALSQLGLVDRFLNEAANGGGRYVSWDNHDTYAKGLLATLAVIETEQLADSVTVVRRDGTVLYANELTPEGSWRRRPAAEQAVQRERSRPWTAPETAVFRRDLARTDRRVHAELADVDRRLAVQRDSERAAAWSEPVRRIAQPRRRAPGVDYHRLSPDEHRWIFDELSPRTRSTGCSPSTPSPRSNWHALPCPACSPPTRAPSLLWPLCWRSAAAGTARTCRTAPCTCHQGRHRRLHSHSGKRTRGHRGARAGGLSRHRGHGLERRLRS